MMFIQTEATPNPATLKFLPGRAVLESGTLDLRDPEAAAQSPLAERLFAVNGVNGVFFGSDFIAVTKEDGGEWQQLKPMIRGAAPQHRERRTGRCRRVLRGGRRRDRRHHQGTDRDAGAAGGRQ